MSSESSFLDKENALWIQFQRWVISGNYEPPTVMAKGKTHKITGILGEENTVEVTMLNPGVSMRNSAKQKHGDFQV